MNADQIIRIIATKGPLIPVHVSKEITTDTTLAGAMLSQLADQKKVFVSHLKFGGSPLYYLKGQEEKLQEFSKNLNEKDRAAFELLKKEKVLQDSEQTPLTKVCLRNIKDFAVPLNVTFGEEKEIFWKWYLLHDEDARELIGEKLKIGDRMREAKKEELENPGTEEKTANSENEDKKK